MVSWGGKMSSLLMVLSYNFWYALRSKFGYFVYLVDLYGENSNY